MERRSWNADHGTPNIECADIPSAPSPQIFHSTLNVRCSMFDVPPRILPVARMLPRTGI